MERIFTPHIMPAARSGAAPPASPHPGPGRLHRHPSLAAGSRLAHPGRVCSSSTASTEVANGWTTSYDVAIGITSPGDRAIAQPAPAWVLSVAGWLAAPAVFGAVAGAVVSVSIGGRRQRPIAEVLSRNGGPRG